MIYVQGRELYLDNFEKNVCKNGIFGEAYEVIFFSDFDGGRHGNRHD